MPSDGALFEVVLAAHVLSALVGFGSVLVTGGYASLARPRTGRAGRDPVSPGFPRSERPGRVAVPDSVRRYFRPGRNWASRVIFLVPVFGLILVGMGGGVDFLQPWLWIGSALWLLAAGVAIGLVWPAERQIASIVNADAPGAALAVASTKASVAAGVVDLAVVAAFVVMIARPGG